MRPGALAAVSGVALLVALAQLLGCSNPCPDPDDLVRSGNFRVSYVREGYEWLLDARVVVDREAGTAKIRYTRDGTTYEVTFMLEE